MKIGILTYFNDLNFGTNLQALATKQIVEKNYPDALVEIIPVTNFKVRKVPYLSYATVSSLLKDVKRILGYYRFHKKELGISNFRIIEKRDEMIQFINGRNYDKIVVGADTVLELTRYKGDIHLSPYWLDESTKAEIVIAAASSREATYEGLTDEQKKQLACMCQKYEKVGVRDDATQRLFSSVDGINLNKISRIPDPTFCFDIDNVAAAKYAVRFGENSKLIGIRHKKGDKWMSSFIDRAHEMGYKVVSFRPCPKADFVCNDISPMAQTAIYEYMDCMVTHLFHEGVFSLKNKTAVVIYPISKQLVSEHGESKYSSLLKDFDLYDSSYVDDPNLLSTQELWDKCMLSMKDIYAKRQYIGGRLLEFANSYNYFIKSTK